MEIVTTKSNEDPLAKVILDGIIAYNNRHAPSEIEDFIVALKDDDVVLAGAQCVSLYDWMHVKLLWVDDSHRRGGLGTKLIKLIEQEAKKRGCLGVHLDTFSFQAKPFYEKLGYEEFGRISDHPRGHCRYFMKKFLT